TTAGVLTYTLDVTTMDAGDRLTIADVSYTVTGNEADNTDLVAALNASTDSTLSQFNFTGTTTVVATAAVPGNTGTVTTSTLADINRETGPMSGNLSSFSTTGFDSDLTTTLEKIESAIDGVATQRAVFGATMNRLEYAIDFIEITFVVVPIVAPVLLAMGLDPVWLGVMIAINLQTSFLTPPFGFALFYLRGVAPASVQTTDMYKGVIPFIGLQLLLMLMLSFYPQIATWLPSQMYG
ncbi:TRAP transporter large permease subunit, partial [Porticoccaceae bacterium]|nr:TRAP transporter large permease subunit [Porticoccaceae bacterium]